MGALARVSIAMIAGGIVGGGLTCVKSLKMKESINLLDVAQVAAVGAVTFGTVQGGVELVASAFSSGTTVSTITVVNPNQQALEYLAGLAKLG